MGRGLFNLVQVGNLKEIHCNFYDNPTANFTLESNALLNCQLNQFDGEVFAKKMSRFVEFETYNMAISYHDIYFGLCMCK